MLFFPPFSTWCLWPRYVYYLTTRLTLCLSYLISEEFTVYLPAILRAIRNDLIDSNCIGWHSLQNYHYSSVRMLPTLLLKEGCQDFLRCCSGATAGLGKTSVRHLGEFLWHSCGPAINIMNSLPISIFCYTVRFSISDRK